MRYLVIPRHPAPSPARRGSFSDTLQTGKPELRPLEKPSQIVTGRGEYSAGSTLKWT